MPASETSAIRSPACEPRQQLRRRAPPRCARGRRGAAPRSRAAASSAARVARVLAEDDVGRAQLGEHAQRDVVEVADRRRADGERHQLASSASNPTNAAPISPAAVPSSARDDRHLVAHRASASRAHDLLRRPASRWSQAATPKPPPITIELGREDVRRTSPIAGAEVARRSRRGRLRLLVALVREPDEPVRVGRRAERLARGRGRGAARAVRLDVAAAGAGALARLAVVDDHDVAELGATPSRPRNSAPPGRRRRRRRCRA